MNERTQILDHAARLRADGTPFALATIVKIEGSAYRRPGARMLITGEGTALGTISGGCLEGEVTQQAQQTLEHGRPETLVFEIDEDDPFLGFGSGCGGTVYVHLERVPRSDAADPLLLIEDSLASREPGVVATVFEADGSLSTTLGRHLHVGPETSTRGALGDASLEALIQADAAEVMEARRSRIVTYTMRKATAEVLLEWVRPPVQLLVYGSGPDVGPVVRQARLLGWHVTVIGNAAIGKLAMRFPEASEHTFLMHPDDVLDGLSVDARTAAIVMNHNLVRDQALLGHLLTADVPYVGALGPRRRTDRMLDALREAGASFSSEELARLYAPVGLDLGAETPEEIALSILAEVQAVLHGRDGQMLREQSGPIHRAVPTDTHEAPAQAATRQ
jgi:xanthine/CO dehydrogenase XdhC/CoxF family maturation factor